MRPVLLIGWQAIHAVPHQNAVHRRPGDGELVKSLQVVGNLARTEAIVLAEIQNLAHYLRRGSPRRSVRSPGPVTSHMRSLTCLTPTFWPANT